MVDKFDSTAHERGTTATIPPQYYVPKKSEDYWIDVVDEGVGKSGLPNKTRRQGILNLLEDRMRKDALLRLGFQELVGDDPSASGIVALMERIQSVPGPQDRPPGPGEYRWELGGAHFPALESPTGQRRYSGYGSATEGDRREIEQRVARGEAPSHLPSTDFESSLPAGAFRNRPIVAYTVKDSPGDRAAPPGYDPAYWRGIMSLAHEIRHAGFEALKRTPTGTEAEMRAVDKILSPRLSPGTDETFMRTYDAAHRKNDQLSRKFMSKTEKKKEGEAMRLYPNPLEHPVQSAAAKMLRNQYAGRELYAPLVRQPR